MTTYLFFTGGYDSTYRLCELLIKEKNAVQPIYISDPYIDNYTNNKTRRRNNSNETNSQEKIIVKIKKMFPETKELLKDILKNEFEKNNILLNFRKNSMAVGPSVWR